MLIQIPYNRENVVNYAKAWAFSRNPKYLDFDKLGGDCTNFASQCMHAGCGIMNYKPVFGWFYNSSTSRTASWSGVTFLYNFLTTNKGPGPYAIEVIQDELNTGDIIQLGNENGRFYHSPVICDITENDIFVAAHSDDAYMRPLSTYEYAKIRYLHIAGVRKYE